MEFLKDFAKLTYEPVTEMFPIYIEKAMTYFHISDSRLRANAVYLITALLVEGSHRDDLTFRQDAKPFKITSVKIEYTNLDQNMIIFKHSWAHSGLQYIAVYAIL